jgi:hypothetical protein
MPGEEDCLFEKPSCVALDPRHVSNAWYIPEQRVDAYWERQHPAGMQNQPAGFRIQHS